MKERFYKIIKFLDDIHLFEYMKYSFFTTFIMYLVESYNLPYKIMHIVILTVLAFAFMNTWQIESKKKGDK